MRKSINVPNPVSFKKRKSTGYKNTKLRFGTAGIKINKNYTLEKLHITTLKKKLKFFLKKKIKLKTKTWFFLTENYPIFKKGKNARMGKGKGMFQRIAFKVKKNQTMLEFYNMNTIFLKKVSNFFYKSTNIKNSIILKNNYHISQNKQSTTYYKIYSRF